MLTERDDIDKQLLLRAIDDAYGLGLHTIAFVPKGQEAYTYVAKAADGAAYFVRLQPADKARELERVYPILHQLQRELSQVLAPLVTRTGRSTIRLGDELVAVFPFVEGVTLWQRGATPSDIQAAVSIIARLHATRLPEHVPREQFDNPFEQPIRHALDLALSSRSSWPPLQLEACRLLAAEHSDILRSLELLDRLGQQARLHVQESVPTHGDPNRDNFLEDVQGTLYLTDWGELAAGPPERDLTHFTGELFEVALRRYISVRPLKALDIDAFAFYEYRWSMQEIADYTTRLLFSELGPTEDEHAWAELQRYLPIRHADIADGMEEIRRVIDAVLGWRR